MSSFFLPNWSPPDDPARPLPAEGRPWPSDDDDDGDDDDDPPNLPFCKKLRFRFTVGGRTQFSALSQPIEFHKMM